MAVNGSEPAIGQIGPEILSDTPSHSPLENSLGVPHNAHYAHYYDVIRISEDGSLGSITTMESACRAHLVVLHIGVDAVPLYPPIP